MHKSNQKALIFCHFNTKKPWITQNTVTTKQDISLSEYTPLKGTLLASKPLSCPNNHPIHGKMPLVKVSGLSLVKEYVQKAFNLESTPKLYGGWRNMNKTLTIALILALASSSLVMVETAYAQSIPSVPEFTIKITDKMLSGIETEIKNQPIIPNGHDSAGIFFNFRFKWHESANWYHPEPDPTETGRQYAAQIGTTGSTVMIGSYNFYYEVLGNSNTHKLDVQIRAINGYLSDSDALKDGPPIGREPGDYPVIVVNTSEWSSTRTITLPPYYVESTTTPNPTTNPSTAPTTEPTIPTTVTSSQIPFNDFIIAVTTVLAAIIIILIVIIVVLVMIYKKIQKEKNLNQ